jgi:threonine synthase
VKRLAESGVIAAPDSIVAVLTGNLLKDPDYTIAYHTEGLTFEGGAGTIEGRFANRPLRVAANKDAIKRALAL